MCQDIKAFEKLLDDFQKVYDPNKPQYEPSYLEICDYPGRRTEEICSRMFAFFFNPTNPHGMGTLFWNTLIDTYEIKCKEQLNEYRSVQNVFARTEIHTDLNNRMDLLLTSDNCMICIENKLWANLNNDLNDYYEYVNKIKGKRHVLYIILSLRKDITDKGNFRVLFYSDFFNRLKEKLGEYITICNAKYLSVLADWIQFLDNEGGCVMKFDELEKKFYIDNCKLINEMVNRRNEYLKDRATKLVQRLNDCCSDRSLGEWWFHDDYLGVGIHFKRGSEKFEIGIESRFEEDGLFNIKLTIWIWKHKYGICEKRYILYNEKIKKEFNRTLENNGQKYQAVVKNEKYENDEKAFEELLDVYKKMCNIVNQTIEEK